MGHLIHFDISTSLLCLYNFVMQCIWILGSNLLIVQTQTELCYDIKCRGEQKNRNPKTPIRSDPKISQNTRPENTRPPKYPMLDRGRVGCGNPSPETRNTRPKNPKIYIHFFIFLIFINTTLQLWSFFQSLHQNFLLHTIT